MEVLQNMKGIIGKWVLRVVQSFIKHDYHHAIIHGQCRKGSTSLIMFHIINWDNYHEEFVFAKTFALRFMILRLVFTSE